MVYPGRRLVSLGDPRVLERIIQEHLIGGRVVEEYIFAVNPLGAGQ